MHITRLIKHAALIAGATFALQSLALDTRPGFYVGAGVVDGKLEIDGVEGDADPTALFARGGYQFNDYLAAEARLGTGLDDDEFHGVKTEIDNFLGIYAKVGIPTPAGFYPYALVGLTRGELKASTRAFSSKEDEDDVSFGVGVDYWFNPQFSLGLEYMQYMDTDDFEFSGLSLGGNYKF